MAVEREVDHLQKGLRISHTAATSILWLDSNRLFRHRDVRNSLLRCGYGQSCQRGATARYRAAQAL